MKESDLSRLIQRELSHGDTRLFRTQVGTLWAGTVISREGDMVTLLHARAVTVGVEGMSDLIGIGPDGLYTAIEVKRPGARTEPERLESQMQFISMVRQLGGRAGIAHSVEDARRIIAGHAD